MMIKDFLHKKKKNPNDNDSDIDIVDLSDQIPKIDDVLGTVNRALRKAGNLKAKIEKEKQIKKEIRPQRRCGCGWE